MASRPKAWMVTWEERCGVAGKWSALRKAFVDGEDALCIAVRKREVQVETCRNVVGPIPLCPQSAIDGAKQGVWEEAARYCDELVAQLKVAEAAAEKAEDYEGACGCLSDRYWPKRLAETFRGLAAEAGMRAMGFTKVPEAGKGD